METTLNMRPTIDKVLLSAGSRESKEKFQATRVPQKDVDRPKFRPNADGQEFISISSEGR
jgi:hypothetical protein